MFQQHLFLLFKIKRNKIVLVIFSDIPDQTSCPCGEGGHPRQPYHGATTLAFR
jgi:hypothetical protein